MEDGSGIVAPLLQATNGSFYGGCRAAGADFDGTVFSLSLGLGPFVKPLSSSGRVGETILILGTDLESASAVAFNGTPAAFAVVSGSEISATVPAGATNGKLQVTDNSGVLMSNVAFRITQ